MYEPKSAKLLTRGEFYWRLARHLVFVSVLIGVSLVAGMLGYAYLAGMSWIDAFLNASMLLGGMGPVGDLTTDASKLFAGFYALYAGLVFIASAGILVAPVAHRILHRLHVDEHDDDGTGGTPRRRKQR
jgi:hypothetical protein